MIYYTEISMIQLRILKIRKSDELSSITVPAIFKMFVCRASRVVAMITKDIYHISL